MCMGSRSAPAAAAPAEVKLPEAPIYTAPVMIQSTPAPARPAEGTTYKKKGKRSLTIPQTSNVNVPGM